MELKVVCQYRTTPLIHHIADLFSVPKTVKKYLFLFNKEYISNRPNILNRERNN